MRLIRPRFTVRRMMVAVAIVAVATAGLIETGKRARLARARRDYERVGAYYEEGRVTLDRYVAASRRLMDARMAVSLTRKGKAAAITTHVERVTRLAEQERKLGEIELHLFRGSHFADLAEAEQEVVECRGLLERLTGER